MKVVDKSQTQANGICLKCIHRNKNWRRITCKEHWLQDVNRTQCKEFFKEGELK